MFVLGLAGGSGSGKSTILDRIMRGPMGGFVSLIPHDAYYLSKPDMPEDVRESDNWDHPDTLDNQLFVEHIQKLKSGESIDRPVYDFTTHRRSTKTERVQSNYVLLVDGILLFAIDEIRRQLDLKIFVDTPADLRIVRRLTRDIQERGRTVQSVTEQYINSVRPMHDQYVEPSRKYADILIPWETQNNQAISLIESHINKLKNEE